MGTPPPPPPPPPPPVVVTFIVKGKDEPPQKTWVGVMGGWDDTPYMVSYGWV